MYLAHIVRQRLDSVLGERQRLYLAKATPESAARHKLAQLLEGVVQQTPVDALPLRVAFVIAHALASSRRAAPR